MAMYFTPAVNAESYTGVPFVSCDFRQFQATLTSEHLTITTPLATENFPLHSLQEISVFDDHPLHEQQVERFVRRRRQLYWFILTPLLALCCLHLFTSYHVRIYSVAATPFLAITISSFLPVSTNTVKMLSGLLVKTDTTTRAFSFYNTNASDLSIVRFLMRVEEAIATAR